MENIWQSEYIQENASTTTSGYYGQWTTRNGEAAIVTQPHIWWYGTETEENKNKTNGCLHNHFKPNTQYLFDFYIDADDSYYSGGGFNVNGGFVIIYTDDSVNYTFSPVGDINNPKGWQHLRLITPSDKSVYGLSFYYYTSTPVYYRWDSSITEVCTPEICKNGEVFSGNLKEGHTETALINGGDIEVNNFIEI